MELKIDWDLKAKCQDHIAESMKSVRIIRMIAKILLLLGVLGGAGNVIIRLAVPSFSLVTVNGVLKKDVDWIVVTTILIVTPCLVIPFLLNVLAHKLAGITNANRIDEKLLVTEDFIQYVLRGKYESTPYERRVLIFPFENIDSISFDKETRLLRISGRIQSNYYDDYRTEEPSSTGIVDEFVICDYFSPSLFEILLKLKETGKIRC